MAATPGVDGGGVVTSSAQSLVRQLVQAMLHPNESRRGAKVTHLTEASRAHSRRAAACSFNILLFEWLDQGDAMCEEPLSVAEIAYGMRGASRFDSAARLEQLEESLVRPAAGSLLLPQPTTALPKGAPEVKAWNQGERPPLASLQRTKAVLELLLRTAEDAIEGPPSTRHLQASALPFMQPPTAPAPHTAQISLPSVSSVDNEQRQHKFGDSRNVSMARPLFTMFSPPTFDTLAAPPALPTDPELIAQHRAGLPPPSAPDSEALCGATTHGASQRAGLAMLDQMLSLPLLPPIVHAEGGGFTTGDVSTGDLLSAALTTRSSPCGPSVVARQGADLVGVRQQLEERVRQEKLLGRDGINVKGSRVTSDGQGANVWRQLGLDDAENHAPGGVCGGGEGKWWETRHSHAEAPGGFSGERCVSDNHVSIFDRVIPELEAEGLGEVVSEGELVSDALLLLLGVSSGLFSLNPSTARFAPTKPVRLPGRSTVATMHVLEDLCIAGSHVHRLTEFCKRSLSPRRECVSGTGPARGRVNSCFCFALEDHLHECRRQIITLQESADARRALGTASAVPSNSPFDRPHTACSAVSWGSGEASGGKESPLGMSLLELLLHTRNVRILFETLARLCHCSVDGDEEEDEEWLRTPPEGVSLLDELCGVVERGEGGAMAGVLRKLLLQSVGPMLSMLEGCLFLARVSDPGREFPVECVQLPQDQDQGVDAACLTSYSLRADDCCPLFLLPVQDLLLRTAQGLSVLRQCKPSHPLSACLEHPSLRLRLTEEGSKGAWERHSRWHERMKEEVRRVALLEERERVRQGRAVQRARRLVIRGLMAEYREIERKLKEAREERARKADALRQTLEAQVQGKKDREMGEEGVRQQLELETVRERDLYGAQDTQELTVLKREAAQRIIREYEARVAELEMEGQRAEWSRRRRELQDQRVAQAERELRVFRDELMLDAQGGGTGGGAIAEEEAGADEGGSVGDGRVIGVADDAESGVHVDHPDVVEGSAPGASLNSGAGGGSAAESKATPLATTSSQLVPTRVEDSLPPASPIVMTTASTDSPAPAAWSPDPSIVRVVGTESLDAEGLDVDATVDMDATASPRAELDDEEEGGEVEMFGGRVEGGGSAGGARAREQTASPWIRKGEDAVRETDKFIARLWSEDPETPQASRVGRSAGVAVRDGVLEETVDETLDQTRDSLAVGGLAWDEDDDDEDGEGDEGVVPLSLATELCLLRPIQFQYRQVSDAALSLLITDLGLIHHLTALRRYLFTDHGNFADTLCRALFAAPPPSSQLASQPTASAASLVSPQLSEAMLKEALMQCSLDADRYAERLTLNVLHSGTAEVSRARGGKDGLLVDAELSYHVEWPLSLVVTRECMVKYQRMWGLMMSARRAVLSLTGLWSEMMQGGDLIPVRVVYAIHALRHEMSHFTSILQGYLMSQVLHQGWTELVASLSDESKRPADLAELTIMHEGFLNQVCDRALLSPRASTVLDIVLSCFDQIHDLRYIVRDVSEMMASVDGHDDQTFKAAQALAKVEEGGRAFRHLASFLYKVLDKMVIKGRSRQSHLKDLLVRLDFNGFYAASQS